LTDWVPNPQLSSAEITQILIEHVGELPLTTEYVLTGGNVVVKRHGTGKNLAVLPAIAVPVSEKSEFACPSTHLSVLQAAVEHVTHVLCVGWRGAEVHFVERFMRHLGGARFMIVAGSQPEADETRQRICGLTQLDDGRFAMSAEKGFTAFLATQELEGFLDS
jgi:hypothetical protein